MTACTLVAVAVSFLVPRDCTRLPADRAEDDEKEKVGLLAGGSTARASAKS
jgi:hypothetical protein